MTTLAIIDANIFISYLLAPDEIDGTIVRTFESISSGAYQLVSSDRLIAELRSSVERKPYLHSRISTGELEALIALIEEMAIPFRHDPDAALFPILRDRKDSYLLDAALGANVDYLVTGDRDLLDIRDELERPRIVTAAEFLGLLPAIEQ